MTILGKERFQDALKYVEKHRLYREALHVWRNEAGEKQDLLNLYGDYLFERREFKQAALGSSANQRQQVIHCLIHVFCSVRSGWETEEGVGCLREDESLAGALRLGDKGRDVICRGARGDGTASWR